MSIYVLPALLALVVKIYVLLVARAANTSRIFSGMVLVFALHNLTELVAYLQFTRGELTLSLFKVYYAATLVTLGYLCLYCIEVARISALRRLYMPSVIWLTMCGIAIMFTDHVVAGFVSIGYSATAEQGPYYWVFSLTSIGATLFVVSSLIYGYRKSNNHVTQIQCLYNLMALTPFVLLGFVIIPLMLLGQEINAGGILPICTTLFLLITLQSESKHRFTDIRRYLPFSKERKIADEVMSLISKFSMDEISYKDLSNEIEKIALKSKLAQADDSISEAARLLKMKRTTLYSMLNRHGIEREGKSDG